jgi:hypothetical protein
MKLIKSTTRFGVYPAMNLGRLCILHFSGGSSKLSLIRSKSIDLGNGLVSMIALNLGRLLFLYEAPVKP